MIKHLVTCTILFCLSLTAYAAEITKERLIFICEVDLRVFSHRPSVEKERQKVQIEISAFSESRLTVQVKGNFYLAGFEIIVPRKNETYTSEDFVRITEISDEGIYFLVQRSNAQKGLIETQTISIDRRTGLVGGSTHVHVPPGGGYLFKGFCNKVEGKALF